MNLGRHGTGSSLRQIWRPYSCDIANWIWESPKIFHPAKSSNFAKHYEMIIKALVQAGRSTKTFCIPSASLQGLPRTVYKHVDPRIRA